MLLEGRKIAVIEDDPIMGESLLQSLSLEGAKVSLYASGQAALKCVVPRSVDLVVCDIRLPDTDGQSLFRHFGVNADAPPFLFMTAFGDIDTAVELMREGAADYLTKPFDMGVFLQRVKGSLRPSSAKADGMTLGVSPAMRDIEHLLRVISKIDSAVLITGETGTGKDVCARFLHQLAEKRGPFMAVNCAAIPNDLLESELFGHEAGAFTGAGKRHLGFAERAGEGTLFLDEIGELASPLQAKLLQLLENRQFYRVGGETPVAFKGRLVAATNADLNTLIAAKRFRLDLYYRINVVEVKIPPLRERPQDIAWLMNQIFADLVAEQGRSMRGVSALAEHAALAHPWPGNVRELKNRLERAIALNLTGWISPQDLFPEKLQSPTPHLQSYWSLANAREAAEKQQIALVLAENDGQIGKTAETLGISRTTLWEKMKRYGLAES
jgi:two-component system response regulator HydG